MSINWQPDTIIVVILPKQKEILLVFNNILWCLQFYSKDFHLIVKFLYGFRESKQTTRKF